MPKVYLYRHFNKDGTLLYVGISLSALARLKQHETSQWHDEIDSITIQKFLCRYAAEDAEMKAIKAENPLYNITHNNKSKVAKMRKMPPLKEVLCLEFVPSSIRLPQIVTDYVREEAQSKGMGYSKMMATILAERYIIDKAKDNGK